MKTASQWKSDIEKGVLDGRLLELYQDPAWIPAQRKRWTELADRFLALYGDKPAIMVSAAGRTEVAGNHTDHQHGRVLAASVNLDTIAMAAPTDDNTVTLASDDYDIAPVSLDNLDPVPAETNTSEALIRGMAAQLKELGAKTGGFEAVASSTVLPGAGLSSSASFEILLGVLFSGLYNEGRLDMMDLAKAGQKAENIWFGKPCGLLDQCACGVGGLVAIDFKDPEKPEVRQVNTDFNQFGLSLCIVDTKGSHADLTDEYAAVPGEMKQIAGYFGQTVLRDVSEMDFLNHIHTLRRQFGDRAVLRALHFFAENERVPEIVQALEADNLEQFRSGIISSGLSSWRFNQNISVQGQPREQAPAVALAFSEHFLKDKGFSRIHGGGFAGTIQAFVQNDTVSAYKSFMESIFGEGSCHILRIRPQGGTIL